ncbi:hypothetical protein EJB05_25286, partial [Eragrostis curvula]
MSSCIPTGLRLDLDMVKAATPPGAHSSPLRPVHSSPSSTLSEASNTSSSATSVSLKSARAPRKRPNQAYNEAAALLASIHPSVFPVKKSPKTAAPRGPPARQLSGLTAAFDPSSDLLPPLPVLADSAFLLRDTPSPHPQSPSGAKNCSSPAPVSSVFRDFRDPVPSPATPDTADELGEIDFDDDCFDAESILDVDEVAAGGAAEGIDSIMGSLTVESSPATTSDDSILSSSGIHPYLRSLMVVGLAGRFELGLGFRHGARPNLNRALKRRDDDGAWWMWPAVPVKDLTVAPPPPPPATPEASNTEMPQAPAAAPEKKKSKKKKVVKVEKVMAKGRDELPNAKCKEEAIDAANGDGDGDADSTPAKAPKTGLGLKLDTDEVLKAWSDKGSMFAEGSTTESPTSAADMRAKLADIDLFPENGAGGIREASVLRYKEKRRTRLFSKKIRYQVRKGRSERRRGHRDPAPPPVLRARAVCRAWRRITSSRAFTAAHAGRRPLELIVQLHDGSDTLDTVPLATLDEAARRSLHVRYPEFPRRANEIFWTGYTLIASCDGLLLFERSTCIGRDLFVCNPVTRQWTTLPRLLPGACTLPCGFYIHGPSGEHRVLCLVTDYQQGWHYASSLEVAESRRVGPGFPLKRIGNDKPVACLNLRGKLHWLQHPEVLFSRDNTHPGKILAFDTVSETFRQISRPPRDRRYEQFFLLEMEGMLAMTAIVNGAMDVWVLEDYNDDRSWTRRHRVVDPAAAVVACVLGDQY